MKRVGMSCGVGACWWRNILPVSFPLHLSWLLALPSYEHFPSMFSERSSKGTALRSRAKETAAGDFAGCDDRSSLPRPFAFSSSSTQRTSLVGLGYALRALFRTLFYRKARPQAHVAFQRRRASRVHQGGGDSTMTMSQSAEGKKEGLERVAGLAGHSYQ